MLHIHRPLWDACGTIRPMQTTIDASGRLLIPQEIQQQAGLTPGMPLEVHWRSGHIEIEPAAPQIKLVRRGRFLVAVAETVISPLTTERVEEARQALYLEREASFLEQDAPLSP